MIRQNKSHTSHPAHPPQQPVHGGQGLEVDGMVRLGMSENVWHSTAAHTPGTNTVAVKAWRMMEWCMIDEKAHLYACLRMLCMSSALSRYTPHLADTQRQRPAAGPASPQPLSPAVQQGLTPPPHPAPVYCRAAACPLLP